VTTGDVTDREGHGQDGQAESQGNTEQADADVRNAEIGRAVFPALN